MRGLVRFAELLVAVPLATEPFGERVVPFLENIGVTMYDNFRKKCYKRNDVT